MQAQSLHPVRGHAHPAPLRNSNWHGAKEKYMGQEEELNRQVPAKDKALHQQGHFLQIRVMT